MIVYGSKSKQLAKEVITDQCSSCGSSNCIDMHVFQKYAHIFWIPLFPVGKTGVTQCDHCKQILKVKQMPSSLAISYENLKSKTKTPIWMFSGLALIAILIVFGVISDREKDKKNAALILTPQRGDIFDIKTKENQYTAYKVEEVQGDSVFFRPSNYETNQESGIDDMKRKGDSSYSQDVYGFSKTELKQMMTNGEILDIDRK